MTKKIFTYTLATAFAFGLLFGPLGLQQEAHATVYVSYQQVYASTPAPTKSFDYLPSTLDVASGDSNLYIGDFNGDGKDDIMRIFNNHLQVFFSDGSGGFTNANSTAPPGTTDPAWAYLYAGTDDGKFHVGDFDGDGDDDIMRSYGGAQQVFLSNRTNAFVDDNQPEPWSNIQLQPDETFYVGNFDGKKGDDLMRHTNNTQEVYLSTDSHNFVGGDIWSRLAPGTEGFFYVGNFDGKKGDDLMRNWVGGEQQIFLATEQKTFDYFLTTLADRSFWLPGVEGYFYVGNFDGQGGDDIMRHIVIGSTHYQQVFIPNGDGGFDYTSDWSNWTTGFEGYFYVGDFDGANGDDIMNNTLSPL